MEGEIQEKVDQWLSWDENKKTLQEVRDLYESTPSEERTQSLCKMFLHRLEFGTAGLRGTMNAGFANMNDLVIIQTTQGLASYIESLNMENYLDRGVVIGFDGRHHSWRFAALTAWTFVKRGFRVHKFSSVCPTPFIPFSVNAFNCVVGIMVTASHNPKEYNGYKVYWDNGAQIIPPLDKDIQKHILLNLKPDEGAWDFVGLNEHPLMHDPLGEICVRYYKNLIASILNRTAIKNTAMSITYTPLHGVGCFFMEQAFKEAGFKPLKIVAEQKLPDPDFPTVVFPNPEEKCALDLALAHADKCGSTLVLANDPDADRLAIAEKNPSTGEWVMFTGNEVGVLLGWWMLYSFREKNPNVDSKDIYMLGSAVSTMFLKSMADIEKYNYVETLTGFKWMGNEAIKLVNQGKHVIFAFEEAMGYMCGTAVLDKDGISAGLHIAEMAVYLKREHKTLRSHLSDLYTIYGHHLTKNGYLTCQDPSKIEALFTKLRNNYPAFLANGEFTVTSVRDLSTGFDSSREDKKATLPSSSSTQMISFKYNNGLIVTLRASGTEPKVKYYSELCGSPGQENHVAMAALQDRMVAAIIAEYLQPKVYNLVPME